MARLEAQKAMCDSSERELHKKFKQKDELEKQIRPDWEQTRKRSRMDDVKCNENNDQIVIYQQPENKPNEEPIIEQEKDENAVLCLPCVNSEHKQLRVFLEEEHKLSEAEMEEMGKQQKLETIDDDTESGKRLQKMKMEEKGIEYDIRFPTDDNDDLVEEDEESRKQRGKGNVEKWLQILLEKDGNDQNMNFHDDNDKKTDEIIQKMNLKYPQKDQNETNENLKYPQKEIMKNAAPEIVEVEEARKSIFKNPPYKINTRRSDASELECDKSAKLSRRKSFEVKERSEKNGKFKEVVRSESARVLRRIPSSPSIILGMKKGVDCIRRKPAVIGDEDDDIENHAGSKNFIKSSYKVIKKAVKI